MKNKRRWLFALVAFIVFMIGASVNVMADDSKNAPAIEKGVYQIKTTDDLVWFQNQVNEGDGRAYDAVLIKDIDMTGIDDWVAIGGGSHNYTGTFDGGGHSIKNFDVEATDTQFIGLFGKVTGTIKNLTMDESCSVTVNITEDFGSNIWISSMICVTREGAIIENCHNEAEYTVNAVGATSISSITACTGGVLGQHSGEAIDCTNSATIRYTTTGGTDNSGSAFIGGVAGRNYNGSLKGSNNNGKVSVSITSGLKDISVYAGGVAGYTDHTTGEGDMENCTNTADIDMTTYAANLEKSGTINAYIGGVSGRNSSLTVACSNKGSITTNITPTGGKGVNDSRTYVYVGGLFGQNGSNSVKDCVNDGTVTLTGKKSDFSYTEGRAEFYVGGIAGRDLSSSINGCENVGYISSEFKDKYNLKITISLGGIVGEKVGGVVQDCTNNAEITGKISIGSASKGTRKTGVVTPVAAGGVAGIFEDATIENCSNDAKVSLELNNETSGSLGGISGISYSGSILECENKAEVNGVSAGETFYVGGIVGDNYTAGQVNAQGTAVGFDTVVDSAINIGDVSVTGPGLVGGIVGHNYTFSFDSTRRYAYIVNSQNIGSVTASNASAGGVAGSNIGYIYNSCNNGDVTGKTVGGVTAGYGSNSDPKIINCYSSGTISGTSKYLFAPGGRTNVVSFCYWLDPLNEAVPSQFSYCDSFGEDPIVSYNGEDLDVALLDALKNKAEEHSEDIYGWRDWIIGDNGYPEIGDYITGSGNQARYQKTPNGEWMTSSFRNALRDVYDGGTVELLADVDLEDTLMITKDVTIISKDKDTPNIITNTKDGHNALLRIRSGDIELSNVILDGGSTSNVTSMEALIVVQGFSKLTIGDGTELRNNRNTRTDLLGKMGGGLNAFEECTVIIEDGNIHNNQSCRGGGIVLNNGAYMLLNGGSVEQNIATDSSTGYGGGGILVYNGTLTIDDGSINENETSRYGGGIYLNVGTVTMNNGTISDNRSDSYGGGIFQRQAAISVMNGPVTSNSFVYLYNGSITGNSADVGGGMAINGDPTWRWNGVGTWGNTAVTNVEITGNTAVTRAGGVDINPGNVMQISDNAYIANNSCNADSKFNDVVLRNTNDNNIDKAGIIIVEGDLTSESVINVDTLFKKDEKEDEKVLIAKGTNKYAIKPSDFDNFNNTNKAYKLLLDTEENCIWLVVADTTIEIRVVTFDTKGGSEIGPTSIISEQPVTKPADPTKDGYTFAGWFTSKDGGLTLSDEEYDFDTPVTEDMTLYAKWVEEKTPVGPDPSGPDPDKPDDSEESDEPIVPEKEDNSTTTTEPTELDDKISEKSDVDAASNEPNESQTDVATDSGDKMNIYIFVIIATVSLIIAMACLIGRRKAD